MEPFKKFWVVTVNNWICDASYNGKDLKTKHIIPSFRKFHFIKSLEDLKRNKALIANYVHLIDL